MNPFIPVPSYEDEYLSADAQAHEDEIERIEKELINTDEKWVSILADYLQAAKGGDIDDEIIECLFAVIDSAINAPFKDRHKPINRIINASFRWKAKELL